MTSWSQERHVISCDFWREFHVRSYDVWDDTPVSSIYVGDDLDEDHQPWVGSLHLRWIGAWSNSWGMTCGMRCFSVFYHQELQLLVGLYWFNHQRNWGYIKGYSQLNVEIGDDSKLVITIFGMLSSTMTPVVWVHWCPNFEPIPMLYPQASFF